MRIESLNCTYKVPFGLNVNIDPKILQRASKVEYDIIVDLLRDMRGIEMDGDVFFKAVEESGKITNVIHTDGKMTLPRLYDKNRSFVISDFVKFLEAKKGWYEDLSIRDDVVRAAFGD